MKPRPAHRDGPRVAATRADARYAWQSIAAALARSGDDGDRKLAASIERFMREPEHEPARRAAVMRVARRQNARPTARRGEHRHWRSSCA